MGGKVLITDAVSETDKKLAPILAYLLEKRGFDFSGYHPPMLERRLKRRLFATSSPDFSEYLACLQRDGAELDQLLDALTINVSRFFRDSLTFELIADRILPALILGKSKTDDRSLRVWSAGCARGEEPYSLAILIHELLEKEGLEMDLHLFATDIDQGALQSAALAVYPLASVEYMQHRLLRKYFLATGESFRLIPEIKDLVSFSSYDMLDKKHGVPPESIFGNFDLVLCRNLLIYFNTEYQEAIFARLHQAIADNGHLVLGEAEAPSLACQRRFSRVFEFSPIYRKISR